MRALARKKFVGDLSAHAVNAARERRFTGNFSIYRILISSAKIRPLFL
jgi:hypothetical protein